MLQEVETLRSTFSFSKRAVLCAIFLVVTASAASAGNYYLPDGRAASLPADRFVAGQKAGSEATAMQCLQGFFMVRNLPDERAESSSYGIDFTALKAGVLRYVLLDRQTCSFQSEAKIDTCHWRDAFSGEEGQSHAQVRELSKDSPGLIQYRTLTDEEWKSLSAKGKLPADGYTTSPDPSRPENLTIQFRCSDGFDVSRFLVDSASHEEVTAILNEYQRRHLASATMFTQSEWDMVQKLLAAQ